MRLTVSEVVKKLEEIGCKLIAGEKGIQNEIVVVDGMEVPDIAPWLIKGELLTTTGYSIRNRKNGLYELIENMKNAEAAGIILKTRFLGEIPKEVIDKADQLGMPVIQTPNDLSFGEVKKIVYMLLTDENDKKHSYWEKIQNEFMKIHLSDGGFQRIVDKVYELIELPVAIIDYTDILVAKSFFGTIPIESSFEDFISETNYSLFKYSNDEHMFFNYGSDRLLMIKVLVQNIVCGYIAVYCKDKIIGGNAQIVLNNARDAVALEYAKMQAIKRNNSVFDDNLFVDIIIENVKNPQTARYRAQSLNWPHLPLLLVLFDIDNFVDYIKSKSELEILHVKNKVTHIISNYAISQNIANTVFTKGDLFFLITSENKRPIIEKTVEKILKKVKEDLKLTLTAACVQGINEYTNIKNANKEASDTIEICRSKYKNKKFLFSEDVLLEQGLMHNDNPYILKYLEATIGKLEKSDEDNNSDLTCILIELIKNMGVRTKTAQSLFIHRNTLSYKIAKIENILNIDLSDTNELLKLGTAIFIKQLL